MQITINNKTPKDVAEDISTAIDEIADFMDEFNEKMKLGQIDFDTSYDAVISGVMPASVEYLSHKFKTKLLYKATKNYRGIKIVLEPLEAIDLKIHITSDSINELTWECLKLKN